MFGGKCETPQRTHYFDECGLQNVEKTCLLRREMLNAAAYAQRGGFQNVEKHVLKHGRDMRNAAAHAEFR